MIVSASKPELTVLDNAGITGTLVVDMLRPGYWDAGVDSTGAHLKHEAFDSLNNGTNTSEYVFNDVTVLAGEIEQKYDGQVKITTVSRRGFVISVVVAASGPIFAPSAGEQDAPKPEEPKPVEQKTETKTKKKETKNEVSSEV